MNSHESVKQWIDNAEAGASRLLISSPMRGAESEESARKWKRPSWDDGDQENEGVELPELANMSHVKHGDDGDDLQLTNREFPAPTPRSKPVRKFKKVAKQSTTPTTLGVGTSDLSASRQGGLIGSQSLVSRGTLTMQPPAHLHNPPAAIPRNATLPPIIATMHPAMTLGDATRTVIKKQSLQLTEVDGVVNVKSNKDHHIHCIMQAFNAPWRTTTNSRKSTPQLQTTCDSWQDTTCTRVSNPIISRRNPQLLQAAATVLMYVIYEAHEVTATNSHPGPRVVGSAKVNRTLKCSDRVEGIIWGIADIGQVREDVLTQTRLPDFVADPTAFGANGRLGLTSPDLIDNNFHDCDSEDADQSRGPETNLTPARTQWLPPGLGFNTQIAGPADIVSSLHASASQRPNIEPVSDGQQLPQLVEDTDDTQPEASLSPHRFPATALVDTSADDLLAPGLAAGARHGPGNSGQIDQTLVPSLSAPLQQAQGQLKETPTASGLPAFLSTAPNGTASVPAARTPPAGVRSCPVPAQQTLCRTPHDKTVLRRFSGPALTHATDSIAAQAAGGDDVLQDSTDDPAPSKAWQKRSIDIPGKARKPKHDKWTP
ncbi:hypothetical protein B0A48_09763 [Cryoendolithus antarcticus]|uniref:Uncharacterized protein n=1 Tax=Cryoendolithus antarcticus TaxID=1507870 RepID=A0A1V8T334_9PEZI|nr:hypothetical protein B0A48_09763 [Cryoendolithus antarcticus]